MRALVLALVLFFNCVNAASPNNNAKPQIELVRNETNTTVTVELSKMEADISLKKSRNDDTKENYAKKNIEMNYNGNEERDKEYKKEAESDKNKYIVKEVNETHYNGGEDENDTVNEDSGINKIIVLDPVHGLNTEIKVHDKRLVLQAGRSWYLISRHSPELVISLANSSIISRYPTKSFTFDAIHWQFDNYDNSTIEPVDSSSERFEFIHGDIVVKKTKKSGLNIFNVPWNAQTVANFETKDWIAIVHKTGGMWEALLDQSGGTSPSFHIDANRKQISADSACWHIHGNLGDGSIELWQLNNSTNRVSLALATNVSLQTNGGILAIRNGSSAGIRCADAEGKTSFIAGAKYLEINSDKTGALYNPETKTFIIRFDDVEVAMVDISKQNIACLVADESSILWKEFTRSINISSKSVTINYRGLRLDLSYRTGALHTDIGSVFVNEYIDKLGLTATCRPVAGRGYATWVGGKLTDMTVYDGIKHAGISRQDAMVDFIQGYDCNSDSEEQMLQLNLINFGNDFYLNNSATVLHLHRFSVVPPI